MDMVVAKKSFALNNPLIPINTSKSRMWIENNSSFNKCIVAKYFIYNIFYILIIFWFF